MKPKKGGALKNELLCEDGVRPLPWVRFGHLDVVQVDVTVRVGEILHRQLMGLLHIEHQAAHLRQKLRFRLQMKDRLQ